MACEIGLCVRGALDSKSAVRYTRVSIYSPWDQPKGLSRGYLLSAQRCPGEQHMRAEPAVKRAYAFFAGQNLFYAAKKAFGYSYPNYDPCALAHAVCAAKEWELAGICFYIGVCYVAFHVCSTVFDV